MSPVFLHRCFNPGIESGVNSSIGFKLSIGADGRYGKPDVSVIAVRNGTDGSVSGDEMLDMLNRT